MRYLLVTSVFIVSKSFNFFPVATSSLSFDSLLSPLLLSMGQGGPISDPFSLIAPSTSKGDTCKETINQFHHHVHIFALVIHGMLLL